MSDAQRISKAWNCGCGVVLEQKVFDGKPLSFEIFKIQYCPSHFHGEQTMVAEFHKAFGVPIQDAPTLPPDRVELRKKLILEEVAEFCEALDSNAGVVSVAHELADILYVVYGAALEFGIDLAPVFAEVHRANMTKVWEDGTVHRREDGKVLKPPTFKRADVYAVLLRQLKGGV